MKRPGDGLSPMLYKEVIGKKLKADLPADHKLLISDLA
jgi:sialic acid synthase SpsE